MGGGPDRRCPWRPWCRWPEPEISRPRREQLGSEVDRPSGPNDRAIVTETVAPPAPCSSHAAGALIGGFAIEIHLPEARMTTLTQARPVTDPSDPTEPLAV